MKMTLGSGSLPQVISSPSQFSLSVTLRHLSNPSISALLDSGATDSFITSSLLNSLGIPVTTLSTPHEVRLADGSTTSLIYRECYITLDIPRFPTFDHWFFDIELPSECPMILGHDFLFKHNPDIDWIQNTIAP